MNTERKIMLVDDQQFNIDALESILKFKFKLNLERVCKVAMNGQLALDAVKESVKNTG